MVFQPTTGPKEERLKTEANKGQQKLVFQLNYVVIQKYFQQYCHKPKKNFLKYTN
jgi:hypothetical protein